MTEFNGSCGTSPGKEGVSGRSPLQSSKVQGAPSVARLENLGAQPVAGLRDVETQPMARLRNTEHATHGRAQGWMGTGHDMAQGSRSAAYSRIQPSRGRSPLQGIRTKDRQALPRLDTNRNNQKAFWKMEARWCIPNVPQKPTKDVYTSKTRETLVYTQNEECPTQNNKRCIHQQLLKFLGRQEKSAEPTNSGACWCIR